MKPHSSNWLNKYIPKLNQIKATIEVCLDCTTNGCDYTNQGGVSEASANNLESKMETSDMVNPDFQLVLT